MTAVAETPGRDTLHALRYARAFYFLFYGAWAALLPFLAIYYQSLGFSGSQIGVLASVPPLVNLFAAPFWGAVADATQRHRRVLLIVISGAMLAVLVLSQSTSFWLLLVVVAAYAFCNAPIVPLIDNSVLELLKERRADYGKQRLWGAVGWGLSAPVVGWLSQRYGLSWPFISYLVLMAAGLLVSWVLPLRSSPRPSPFWVGMRQLLADRRWLVFLAVVLISGAGQSVVNNYLFLYLDELEASRTVMGLALSVATLSELPAFFFSGWMLRRWGARGVLLLSLAAYVLRAYLYASASEPWQALLIQLFHGLTFSAMWAAGVSFAGQLAPPGLGATAQGMFTSTAFGLGGISGALLGGILFDRVGGAGLFRVSGTAVLLGLILFWIAQQRWKGSSPP